MRYYAYGFRRFTLSFPSNIRTLTIHIYGQDNLVTTLESCYAIDYVCFQYTMCAFVTRYCLPSYTAYGIQLLEIY